MGNFDFSKILYLPSGGASYSSIVRCFPITNEAQMLSADPHLINSTLEYIVALVSKYCELEIPAKKLYTQDLYYIWLYFLSTDLLTGSAGIYYSNTLCTSCQKMNKVAIDLSKLSVKVYNPYENVFQHEFVVSVGGFDFILYKNRTVENNITFSNMIIDFEDFNPSMITYSKIYYILTQTKEIYNNGNEIKKYDWLALMRSLSTQDMAVIFNKCEKERFWIGPDMRIYYNCKHCKAPNKTMIVDDFAGSFMSPNKNKKIILEQEDFFNIALNTARLPIFTITEFLDMPMRYSSAISNVISKIEFAPTSII